MNIVIIEDESAAADRLMKLLENADPTGNILAVIDSVESAVRWFEENRLPDLIFLDIQLSDGLGFEIFEAARIEAPVIVTTAYDQYALRAFELNSIDYLLKPISGKDLSRSLEKFRRFGNPAALVLQKEMAAILSRIRSENVQYRSRFLVRVGEILHPVICSEIAYFCMEDQLQKIVTRNGKRFVLDTTLDKIEDGLDPKLFFRINRQMIVSTHAVSAISPYFNNRLSLQLTPPHATDVIVSREKVKAFKHWLGG